VVLHPEIKSKLISILMQEIHKERDGQKIETTQLRQVIQMLVEVGISSKKIYESEFEQVFIAETQNYYRVESNQLITSHSCFAFLQKARRRHQEELDRVLSYLDNSTQRILMPTFLREYIEQHAVTLVNMEHSGLIHMIKNQKYEEIRLMHELFSKVPEAHSILTKTLHSYITSEGSKLVADESLKHD
jgi:cullin 3